MSPAAVQTTEAESAPVAVRIPSWGRVMLAPILDLFRPRAAAASLASASGPTFATILVLSLLSYTAVLIALMLWEGTITETWAPGPPSLATMPATVSATSPMWLSSGQMTVESRTLSEVWAEWRRQAIEGWFGQAELTVVLVLVLGMLALLFLAWLNLPLVHSSGSVWASCKRSFRASSAVLWPLIVLTLASGVVFVSLEHADILSGRPFRGPGIDRMAFAMFSCVAGSAVLLGCWLRSAISGVECGDLTPALPPRCEGCGYDLTHQPADRRCPECGLGLDASLDEAHSRPGSTWSRTRTGSSWRTTSYSVLFHPYAFYRALKLRTPAQGEIAFARRHYLWIGCGALMWMTGMLLIVSYMEGPPPLRILPQVLAVGCVAIIFGVVGCWFGHRLVAALVVTAWLATEPLPDFRWAVKVVAYETTFLWVFCAFWGALLAFFVLAGRWLTDLVGSMGWSSYPLGFPLAFWGIFGGTVALAALWLRRYTIAYRAIRWSNF